MEIQIETSEALVNLIKREVSHMVSYLRLCNNGSIIITFIITGDKHVDYYIESTRFSLTFSLLCDSAQAALKNRACLIPCEVQMQYGFC